MAGMNRGFGEIVTKQASIGGGGVGGLEWVCSWRKIYIYIGTVVIMQASVERRGSGT